MSARARHAVFAALLALGVGALATAAAAAAEQRADVQTQAPTAVDAAPSAVLHGLVNPNTRKTTYWFELGTTLAYGTTTNPASAGKGDKPVTVTASIGSLEPATTYHVRVVASNDRGVSAGRGRDLHDVGHRGSPPRRRCPLPPPRRRCPGPSSRPRPRPRRSSGAA